MPITLDDIKLLASQRLDDTADGGGLMTGAVVQDGVENNLFPDISSMDRTLGRVQLRKSFVAVLSEGTDAYLGAHVILDDAPDDPAVGACIFAAGGQGGTRDDAMAALAAGAEPVAADSTRYYFSSADEQSTWFVFHSPAGVIIKSIDGAIESNTLRPSPVSTGTYLLVRRTNPGVMPASYAVVNEVTVVSVSAAVVQETLPGGELQETWSLHFQVNKATNSMFPNDDVPTDYVPQVDADATFVDGDGDYLIRVAGSASSEDDDGDGAAVAYGVTATTGITAAAATALSVESIQTQIVPFAAGADYPGSLPDYCGIDPEDFQASGGYLTIFRAGEPVVLHHTDSTAPAVVAATDVVDVGRTNLARLRVIGADGQVITAGYTADLEAGTATFDDVTGYSQPVTVEHRIEHVAAVTAVTPGSPDVLSLNRPVPRSFPAGSKVSSVLVLGDLQARVQPSFAQATWGGVFSDSLIGSAPLADFNEAAAPIVVENAGAITERWVCIFTNTTTFRVIGEQVGEVLTGATGTDTAPVNPATAEPYFTIPAGGWGVGWAIGNCLRFNTEGANAPVWAARTTSPSDPFEGPDSLTIGIRGDVDAP